MFRLTATSSFIRNQTWLYGTPELAVKADRDASFIYKMTAIWFCIADP
jgi:hypothetical protein